MILRLIAVGLAPLYLLACQPKVQIVPSEKPIVINLNVKIDQEVRVRTVILLGTSESALAQSQSAKVIVDTAKERGTIGETPAGYLAIVGGETAAERNAMNEINIKRKALYTRKARAENLQVEVVAAIFGEKQILKAFLFII